MKEAYNMRELGVRYSDCCLMFIHIFWYKYKCIFYMYDVLFSIINFTHKHMLMWWILLSVVWYLLSIFVFFGNFRYLACKKKEE